MSSDVSLPPGFHVRAMTQGDIPAVLEAEQELFPLEAWTEETYRAELARTRPRVVGMSTEPGTHVYLVIESPTKELAAYAGMMCIPPHADVLTIGTRPKFGSRGLGAHLLQTMIDQAQSRGADTVLLEVRADNSRAQALYKRFGFTHIHTRPHYYPPGIDAYVMQKQLT